MSTRITIDYGIDLGTTNSAIAALDGVQATVIKNNRDQDITPSAVAVKKDGAILLGERARGSWVSSIDDAHIEFKRRMGTNFGYEFKSSGRMMKPEELSAEVLKSMRADVLAKRGEELQAAVITIPAAFELHQCEATKRAAQLAGFHSSPLLQEPVAAALAYGFQADAEKSFWMVYDFGGGTFDAALIKAEDGVINVVNHGGDNFLGGSDIDWAIVESLVIPRLQAQYDLPDFHRGNKRWEVAMRKLKRAVENAKIELSRSPSISLDECQFTDAGGNDVEVDLTISASDIARIAEPIIHRSVDILKTVLQEKKLDVSVLNRLILVGGPTKAPYFREQLRSELGMQLDLSVDPMTAVAQGAAVFAGTQRLNAKAFQAAPVQGEISLDVQYKPVGHEADPLVAGRATASGVKDFSGHTIEFVNKNSQWRSGKISLRADGTFISTLLAEKGERNTFAIELCNTTGTRQITSPAAIVYTVGSTVEEQPLGRSIGVALGDNTVDWFFLKGSGLPQRKRAGRPYFTTKTVTRGSSDALEIPLVEGEQEAADRNRRLSVLRVRGTEIKHDLLPGTAIEVTLNINESRLLRLDAYIPTLDQEFLCETDMMTVQITPNDLQTRWALEQKRIHDLIPKAEKAEDRDAQRGLTEQLSGLLAQEIKRELNASANDPDACEKTDKRLLEFALQTDVFETRLEWPTAVTKAQDWVTELESTVAEFGTDEQRIRADLLTLDVEACITDKDAVRLKKKTNEVCDLYWTILRQQDLFWIREFKHMEHNRFKIKDPHRGADLINQGNQYLSSNKHDALRNIVRALWALWPRETDSDDGKAHRGVGSTLTRG